MSDAPFPNLQIHPTSGAMSSIPWADTSERASMTGGLLFAPDGCSATMEIYITWSSLYDALTAILGFSSRITTGTTAGRIGAMPPADITGATNTLEIVITSPAHGLIDGDTIFVFGVLGNVAANGRWFITKLTDNTFQLRGSDGSTAGLVGNGVYVTNTGNWIPTGAILHRQLPWQHPIFNQMWARRIQSVHGMQLQGTNFIADSLPNGLALGGAGPDSSTNLGPFSEFSICKLVIEFWRPPYSLLTDEAIVVDGKPREWLRYTDREWSLNTQLLTRENTAFHFQGSTGPNAQAITGAGQKVSHMRVTRRWYNVPEQALFTLDPDGVPEGLPLFLQVTQTQTINPVTGYIQRPSSPIAGCVNSPIGGGTVDSARLRMFGTNMGTMLLEGLELEPVPLQLPPILMGLRGNPNSPTEPISQNQYNVMLHFDIFTPPIGPGVAVRGHNLLPKTVDGLWYPVISSGNAGAGTSVVTTTPTTMFQYCDMSDLFEIL